MLYTKIAPNFAAVGVWENHHLPLSYFARSALTEYFVLTGAIMNYAGTVGLLLTLLYGGVRGRRIRGFLGAGILCSVCAWAVGAENLHRTPISSFAELQDYFRPDESKPVIISGHRGGMLPGYPENSIEAMEKTLTILPSFFEIDPQLTKDGVMVLMHDKTLDRTTTMKGKVSDYTYAELQQARLKDRQGTVTDYKIPTLKEVFEWGKGKTIFNLDNKGVPWESYVELLKGNDYPNIVLSMDSVKEAQFYDQRLDNVMLCISIKNQHDLDRITSAGVRLDRLIAYVGPSMDPAQAEFYKSLREKGIMCFISLPPTRDKAATELERSAGYIEELMKKPDIIETDYPALFGGMR
jgi:glycerophosphoryl diester phosphodiesterase